MKPRRIVVVGLMGAYPFAGMAWMHMQITVGLRRLGHDAYYFEFSSEWPYDPVRQAKVNDSDYSVPYLARVAERFGLRDRWAYRRSYSDHEWLGMERSKAEELLAHADAVFNVAGASRLHWEELPVGRWIYYGTDPVYHEIAYAKGEPEARSCIDEHSDCVTYGENIGTPESPIPPLPRLRARTRQPILVDLWAAGPPCRQAFTTVCNWKQVGHEVEFRGETYYWSKDREFWKFIDLPKRVSVPLELATNIADDVEERDISRGETISAMGPGLRLRQVLESYGWSLTEAQALTLDPWVYQEYVKASSGEFTVAKDQNVRLRSGWFSERDACYLAAGRPVICQDTGIASVLPTGEGLFVFNTMDDVLDAFEAIQSDYERHSRAARAIAEDYFRAETVMTKLLDDLGL